MDFALLPPASEGCFSLFTLAGCTPARSGWWGGYPIPGQGWGVPQPGQDGGGGTPSQIWGGGTPARSGWWVGYPFLDLGWGYPSQVWMVGGYPIPGLGGTPVRSGWWGGTPARSECKRHTTCCIASAHYVAFS